MTLASKKFASVVFCLLISSFECSPKYDLGGFIPSSMDYMDKEKAQDQLAVATQDELQAQPRSDDNFNSTSRSLESEKHVTERNQEPRFGFTNVGSTGSGYGVSSYAPARVDLGGLILGAVIGIGTILIIPKLLYVISGSYGSYARNDDGIASSMTKLDDILARHGIDTTSCMQRAVCTYAKKAADTIRTANDIDDDEKVSSFDRMVETLTTNQIFRTALRGTAIQEAIEAGRNGQSCNRSYRQCGFSMDSIMNLVSNVLSTVTQSDSHLTAPAAAL